MLREAKKPTSFTGYGRALRAFAGTWGLVALTADHGMGDKSAENGEPNVIWLQDVLDQQFGSGSSQVICPITDAFVGHHGALGGFVRVYLGRTRTVLK